ncbi:ABC1 kinase family protein [Kyrpidia spormannii]|uniref:ABC transporter n=1 Tax=Kyrpidia spormannii TaxID=2055160 RepID=A0A6F9E422_9BACL|nr:AarF/ABC1/UbiB kinase family protein [Kyrpidia spormannii]CAB3391243.1 ABC transporter [Kyrpidia spormannii]
MEGGKWFMGRQAKWRRVQQITRVFLKHGFGYLWDGRKEIASPERGRSMGRRLRQVCEELGPTFVKLGQLISTRPDLVSPEVAAELEQLQDQVPPVPFEVIARRLEEEFDKPIDRLFSFIDPTPLAAASIGQVHKARLPWGQEVAVKVQRPGIEGQIETDVAILEELAAWAEVHTQCGKIYPLTAIVGELRQSLRRELDYRLEAQYARQMRRRLPDDGNVYIPEVVGEYSTRRVFTAEYMEGSKLSSRAVEALGQERKRRLARIIAETILHQMLVDGLFHADPHPGNWLVKKDGSLVLLDFGMVGRLTPEHKSQLADLIIALMRQDTPAIVEALLNLGVAPADVDRDALYRDVEEIRDQFYEVPLHEIDIRDVVQLTFELSFRHQIRLPTHLTLVGKAMVTLGGVVEQLDPSLSIVELAEPFGTELFVGRYTPRAAAVKLAAYGRRWRKIAEEAPDWLAEWASAAGGGEVRLGLRLREGQWALRRVERAVNRLAASVILLSLAVVVAALVLGGFARSPVPTWFYTALTVGLAVIAAITFWLIMEIMRSGKK